MEVWRGFQEGLPIIIVNPGVIFGPGFWTQGSGEVFSAVKKGFPFYTNGTSGYVSVIDVVSIMHQLMHSNCNGERFILISENCTYKNILTIIAKKIGARTPNIKAKPWLLNLAWRLDWLATKVFRTKRKLSKHSIASLQNTNLFSNEKIKKQLGYTFLEMDAYLDEVLLHFIK
jgi:dihydroflavonol-4-reductase